MARPEWRRIMSIGLVVLTLASVVLRFAGFGRHSAVGWLPVALLVVLAVLRRVGWLVLGGRGGRFRRDRQPPAS